ncbi:MAG: Hsp20/alpha crystallin family protein [Xanthomonadales bacterium]|nr:Hsp20/alpha crystallin family protein [Xanthomonadales bacterium]MCB1626316.1 Hsp20/alpha crystallin family protein [Xanthomonadales bacterium]MCB1633816.1 Hsp20/alpha crystallin family protein [Xanthomonadales bacterium]
MTLSRFSYPQNSQFPQEVQQFFDKFFGNEDGDQSSVVTAHWAPRVDIKEEPSRFVIHADIPGVDTKDIEIHMDKGVLTIRGERQQQSKEENTKFTRVERQHGVFYRRFALPDSADAEGITATGRNGVLEVVIPKRPESTPRRITVS